MIGHSFQSLNLFNKEIYCLYFLLAVTFIIPEICFQDLFYIAVFCYSVP